MKSKKPYDQQDKSTIDVHEKFIPYNIKSHDSKYRITLGNKLIRTISRKMTFEAYRILVGKNGDILLRPTISIPSNEAWVYNNPKVISKIRKGLKESKAGKIERVNDLDSFLENL